MEEHLFACKSKYPALEQTIDEIQKCIYVDNIVTGIENVYSVTEIRKTSSRKQL